MFVSITMLAFAILVPALHAQAPPEKITVDDKERTFIVHLPKGYDAKQHYALVILLHTRDQDAGDMEQLTRFDELADRDSVIAVYPNSTGRGWNLGITQEEPSPGGMGRRGGRHGGWGGGGGGYPGGGYPGGGGGYPGGSGGGRSGQSGSREDRATPADDNAFIDQLLDKLSSEYSVDASRVYVTGLSDGGFMAFRLGCTMADRFAAIAAVGAAMPKTMTCLPSHPLSVLMMDGTSDPIVHYNGGHVGRYGVLSAEDSAKYWAKLGGCQSKCQSKPQRQKLSPRERGGMKTEVDTYDDCQKGAQVALYSIDGGGNTWPGGEQYLVEKVIGKTSDDLNANEVIWSFFVRHQTALPEPRK
ncbi:putative Poly(3-hydroxybutyrate) depolymerase [Candidatus Sulfotelmatobacter sp. SbA7]|nr:putative Poly(3-hydroxybutyrate) depolymerase [Candidatus Sulfotelmatobacter sp. SbA7]